MKLINNYKNYSISIMIMY